VRRTSPSASSRSTTVGGIAVRHQQHPAQLAHRHAIAAAIKGGHHVKARQVVSWVQPQVFAQIVLGRTG
jgi:hypothetical protein